MDKIEFRIVDSDNNIEGVLDVGDSEKFPFTINDSISDITTLNKRSGSFSSSFNIPSTKNNDNFLEHLYLSSHKNYKDFDAEKTAELVINDIDIDRGKLKIKSVITKENKREYKGVFFGNNMEWVKDLRGKTMQDLPYLDNTYTYSATTIENSWSNLGGTDSQVYSLINRGKRVKADETNVRDFYPDYFALDVLNNAFKSVGYNFSSNFFEETRNKGLLIPFWGENFKLTQAEIDAEKINVEIDTSATYVDSTYTRDYNSSTLESGYLDVDINTVALSFDEAPLPLFDNGNNFASGVYTVPFRGYYKFKLDLDIELTYGKSDTYGGGREVVYKLEVTRGASTITVPYSVVLDVKPDTDPSNITDNGATFTYRANVSSTNGAFIELYENDEVRIKWEYIVNYIDAPNTFTNQETLILHGAALSNDLSRTIAEDKVYNWKTVSDDNIDLLDLITDIGNLFNIYWRTDRKTKTVHAEPRDSFYNDLSTAENWTDRIYDKNQYSLEYINEKYKKTNVFKYSKDDNDKFLNLRNEAEGYDWCSYNFDYPEKFKEGTTKIELKVLAATYHLEDIYCTTESLAPYTARIWDTSQQGVLTNSQLPEVDNEGMKPRLLYYNYDNQEYNYPNGLGTVLKTFKFNGVDKGVIPFALSMPIIIDGETVADTGDANNVLSYKDVSGNDGLYYQHFSKTAGTIVNGRILNINLLFDLVDYVDFDFRKPIYFDNRYQDIEGYWYVQKIKSFKPASKQAYCSFELIEAFPFERYDANGDVEVGNDNESQIFAMKMQGAGSETYLAVEGIEESVNIGYNNRLPQYGGNTIVGNNLETDGIGVQRIGNNNVDVSTDLFQLSSNGVNIITQDEDGNILIMGRKQPTIESVVLDVSSDFTANSETLTYVVDTSSGDITATLPSSQNVGQTWNIKKISKDYKITIVTEGSELIDDKESLIIKSLSSARLQFDGTNYIII